MNNEWKCIGHSEYGDKISLDGHSYIEVPTDYIKQVRSEERAKIRKEYRTKVSGMAFVDPSSAGQFAMFNDGYNQAIEEVVELLTPVDN